MGWGVVLFFPSFLGERVSIVEVIVDSKWKKLKQKCKADTDIDWNEQAETVTCLFLAR